MILQVLMFQLEGILKMNSRNSVQNMHDFHGPVTLVSTVVLIDMV